MSRRPAHRIAAWLMALLLALVALEPLRAHACPLHDGVPAAASADDAHAGHGAAHDGTAPAGESDRHPCDCLGSCGLAAAVALPAATLVALDGAERMIAAPPSATAPETAAIARERLLPFANGPPALG